MKRLSAKSFSPAFLLVSSAGYADRKHGDVENIGNRSVRDRSLGSCPIGSPWKRRLPWATRSPRNSSKRPGLSRTR